YPRRVSGTLIAAKHRGAPEVMCLHANMRALILGLFNRGNSAMSDGMAPGCDAAWLGGPGPHAAAGGADRSWPAPDARRPPQLVLGGFGLLAAVLQYQSFMSTGASAVMLAESAQGTRAVIAGPVTCSARLIDHHVVVLNAIFATI